MKPYYDDGSCVIFHGDCEEVLPTLGWFDLIVTSPPYNLGVGTGGGFGHYNLGSRGGSSKWHGNSLEAGYDGHDDAMPLDEYEDWQRRVIDLCYFGNLADAGAMFYNHKPRVQAGELWTPLGLIPENVELRQIITWARSGGMNFAPTHYVPTYEWILVLARPEWRLKSKAASGAGDVWRIHQEASEHPAPFPLGLPARAIETTNPQWVLDPFLGSGTTLRAAKDAGVLGVGIEKSEAYCEIAARRLDQQSLFGAAS